MIDSGVNGAPVISEEEFNELKRLQQLKEQYRATQEDMETAKRGLRYCERQVQLARQKLVEGIVCSFVSKALRLLLTQNRSNN